MCDSFGHIEELVPRRVCGRGRCLTHPAGLHRYLLELQRRLLSAPNPSCQLVKGPAGRRKAEFEEK